MGERSTILLWRQAGGVFLIFIGVWAFVALSGVGIIPDVAHWNEVSIPILAVQMLVAGGLTFLIEIGLRWLNQERKARWPERLLPFLLWMLAAGIWLAEPMRHSFSHPRPSPPYDEYYPVLDSMVYDLGAQYALIGQGINNNLLTEKPVYMAFLSLLHLVGGQSVRVVSGLQVLILALWPVFLYALGRRLHHRSTGIFVAVLGIFKERNAIAASVEVQTVHVKMWLTESLTALMLVVVVWWVVRWWQQEQRSISQAVWLGGLLGVAFLLRTNTFLIVLLLIGLMGIAGPMGQRWRMVVFLLIGFLAFVSPWMVFNRDEQGKTALQLKIENVLQRYWFQRNDTGASSHRAFASRKPTYSIVHSANRSTASVGVSLEPFSRDSALWSIPSHFLHNQIGSLFVLPVSVRGHSLEAMVKGPIWEITWSGALRAENALLLFMNLGIVALGIAAAWQRWRVTGLVPALVQITYYFSNALARTSGGRYLVPVDWVVYFYFGLGAIEAVHLLLKRTRFVLLNEHPELCMAERKERPAGWLMPALAFLLLGGVMPLLTGLPDRYPTLTRAGAFRAVQEQVSLSHLGWTRQQFNHLFRQPQAVVLHGRLLYPRYLAAREGLCRRCLVLDAAFGERDYPRLSFVVLGPVSAGVIVPLRDIPADFRQVNLAAGPDVWVIGCREQVDVIGQQRKFYPAVQALALLVYDRQGKMHLFRPDSQSPACE